MKKNTLLVFACLFITTISSASFAEEFGVWGEAWGSTKISAKTRAQHLAKRRCLQEFGKIKLFSWSTTCEWYGWKDGYRCTASATCKD